MKHALASLLGEVQRTVRLHDLLEAGDRVLVAVSGGPDSVGLLAVLSQLRHRLGIEIVAGHVNHRLRGAESLEDERAAAAAAERLGVPFVRADLPASLARGGNLEARARILRYRTLRQLARRAGCGKIATGHTQDDQAETLLLKLVRGAGMVGLGAIRPRRNDGVIRPLLDCRREDVHRAAESLDLDYRLDSSNLDPRFQRNRIRHRVMPLLVDLNPDVVGALAGAATRLRQAGEILCASAEAELAGAVTEGSLSASALLQLPADLRSHVVYSWLLGAGGTKGQPGSRHVEAVVRLVLGGGGGAVGLPGGREVRLREGWLSVSALRDRDTETYPPTELSTEGTLRLPGGWCFRARRVACRGRRPRLPRDLWSAIFAVESSVSLLVRLPRRGDRVRPLGLGGSRKLSDLFTDRKIPSDERWRYPVVEVGGDILWVPGVVRSEGRILTARSMQAVRLSAARGE